jgi:hypothetical protein
MWYMSETVTLLVLNPTGTYEETKGVLGDKMVLAPKTAVMITREDVFVRHKPSEASQETLQDIVRKPPTFASGPRCIVVCGQDPVPVRWDTPPDEKERVQREAKVFKQVSRVAGTEEEAKVALEQQRRGQVMLLVAVALVVVVVVAGIVILASRAG